MPELVDAADYTVWPDNLGAGAGSGSLASVLEPSVACLTLAGLIGFAGWRRRDSPGCDNVSI